MRQRRGVWTAIIILLMPAPCSWAATPETEAANGGQNIVYASADGTELLLDLYVPEDAAAPVPVILWVHGGGWQSGSKGRGGRARGMMARGFAVADIDYRLTDVAAFPAQIRDCRAAVRWIRANADKYRLDPNRIGAWGGSAGAHLVALLGTADDETEEFNSADNPGFSSRVQAVCDWFGPTDFMALGDWHNNATSPEAKLIGGPLQDNPEKCAIASPVTYVSKDDPPFFIVHGDNDQTVPLAQSETFLAKLKAAGVDASLYVVKGGGHGGEFGDEYDSVLKMSEDFFAKVLAKAGDEESKHEVNTTPDGKEIPETIEARFDVEYGQGGDSSLKMDIMRPKSPAAEKIPALVWVHGGGWSGGDKNTSYDGMIHCAQNGYFCAAINYRLSGQATFPAQIEDCKCAIRYLRAHAGEYGIDPDHIGVRGASAGGHLVALLGTAGDATELEGHGGWPEYSSRVQAVCDLYGPTDFALTPAIDNPQSAHAKLIGGPLRKNPDKVKLANPIAYVTPGDPPFLIIHGIEDTTVSISQSALLFEALRRNKVESTFVPVAGGGHGSGFDYDVLRPQMDAFFDKHLKNIEPAAPVADHDDAS